MSVVICSMVDCKHRSTHPLRKYTYKDGRKCYGCKLDVVEIIRVFDPDNYVIQVINENEMSCCKMYEPKESEESSEFTEDE